MKHHKKNKCPKEPREKRRRRSSTSSSSSSQSDEWVEKESKNPQEREDWMSMTGMLKTYTKDDPKPKQEKKGKNNIDSYNPAKSSRELNPYWKDGGSGLPQNSESFQKSRPFVKPSDDDDDDYYRSSSSNRRSDSTRELSQKHERDSRRNDKYNDSSGKFRDRNDLYGKSYNWKKKKESEPAKNEKSTFETIKSNESQTQPALTRP